VSEHGLWILQSLQPGALRIRGPCFTFKLKHSSEYRGRVAAIEFANLFFFLRIQRLSLSKWSFDLSTCSQSLQRV
jgi:hypothetical protein